MCGGTNCNPILIFCNSFFNSVDAALLIMFNFCACPVVSNVSYNTSYSINMSESLLDLMGYTKIAFVSYAYNISMHYISLLIVNWKRSVRYVYTFPVSGSARHIAANT